MANQIYLQSPNNNFWILSCTDQGALTLTPATNSPFRFANPNLTVAGVNWVFTPTNNGALQITQINKAQFLLPYLVLKSSPSNIVFQITMDELGRFGAQPNPTATDFVPGTSQSQYLQRPVICYTAANQQGVVMADESVWCSAVNTFVPWVETNASKIVLSEIE